MWMSFRIFGPRVGPRRVDAALRAASTLLGPKQMQSHKTHVVLYHVVRISDFFGVVESGGPLFLPADWPALFAWIFVSLKCAP